MDLLEHEAVVDAGIDAGDAAVDAPTDVAATEDAPVVETPDLAAPEPEYLTADQAREIADARFGTLLQQYQEQGRQQYQEPGEPINLVDEFGQVDPAALMTLLSQRDEHFFSRVEQMFQPVQSRMEQDVIQQGEQRLNELVDGLELGDSGKNVVKQLAPMFLSETEQTWGKGTAKAAEAALAKAGQVLQQVEQDAYKRGQAANATHLAAVGGAPNEPGGNAAVSQPEAGSVAEALENWKARRAASLTAA